MIVDPPGFVLRHVEPTSPRSRGLSRRLTKQGANDPVSRSEKLATARHFGAAAGFSGSYRCRRRANARFHERSRLDLALQAFPGLFSWFTSNSFAVGGHVLVS